MAITSICGKLLNGIDLACIELVKKYYQQVVVINKSEIAEYVITPPTDITCAYSVTFTLNEGSKGHHIIGNEAGSTFFGSVDKARGTHGNAEYTHNVQILMAGLSEESKCILDALDKGSYVVALQAKNGTVEIYGIGNGMSTGDYTYNIQEDGGGTPIMLSSLEDATENMLPLVYVSAVPGSEEADFNTGFENPVIP